MELVNESRCITPSGCLSSEKAEIFDLGSRQTQAGVGFCVMFLHSPENSREMFWGTLLVTCIVPKRVPILGTSSTFWVPIYISGSLFSVFWVYKFMRRMLLQSACAQQSIDLTCLLSGSSWTIILCCEVHCWQILFYISAYTLDFINCCFGSLFWLPRVPIGSLFHEKLGPYF